MSGFGYEYGEGAGGTFGGGGGMNSEIEYQLFVRRLGLFVCDP